MKRALRWQKKDIERKDRDILKKKRFKRKNMKKALRWQKKRY